MRSRHTNIGNGITRSFGIEDKEDLVVELTSEGEIVVRKEPVDRKLKRGEKLPELRLKADEAFETRRPGKSLDQQEKEAVEIIDILIKKIPIASFEDDDPKPHKVDYRAKIWLLKNAQQIADDIRTGLITP